MKKLFLLLLILTSTSYIVNAQSESSDVKKIKAVLEDQRIAWNNGMIKDYMQGYWNSESLVFIGKNGPKYGWQNTLDNYVKGYPDKKAMGFLTFDIKEVRLLNSKNAFVIGAWNLKRESDEPKG
ncbi:MAG: DUF4440 domain-containing protein, partial [Daejeonella sp.]